MIARRPTPGEGVSGLEYPRLRVSRAPRAEHARGLLDGGGVIGVQCSAAGALVHAQEPVAKGAQVRVECLGVVCDGGVRWSIGKRFGLLFDRTLSDEQVAMLASPASAATA